MIASKAEMNEIWAEVNQHRTELELLNSLIGSIQIEEDFLKLTSKHPEVIPLLPRLLGFKEIKLTFFDDLKMDNYDFKNNLHGEDYLIFMRKTGLFEFLEKKIVSNLVEYLFGFEMGIKASAEGFEN